MKRSNKLEIAVDDIVIGSRITVLRNRTMPGGNETGYLKGTVLHVTAISLPYILVEAFCPRLGKSGISLDIREFRFGRINDEYANAVIARCNQAAGREVPYYEEDPC